MCLLTKPCKKIIILLWHGSSHSSRSGSRPEELASRRKLGWTRTATGQGLVAVPYVLLLISVEIVTGGAKTIGSVSTKGTPTRIMLTCAI